RPDLPQLNPGAQVPGQVADERPEVDPVRRGEVDGVDVLLVQVVDADHLHRQAVAFDQSFGDAAGLGPAALVGLVAGQVFFARYALTYRQPGDVLTRVLRRPHALRHLGPGVGRDQHLVAHFGAVLAGIEVVEPPVAREAHGHDHSHGLVLAS